MLHLEQATEYETIIISSELLRSTKAIDVYIHCIASITSLSSLLENYGVALAEHESSSKRRESTDCLVQHGSAPRALRTGRGRSKFWFVITLAHTSQRLTNACRPAKINKRVPPSMSKLQQNMPHDNRRRMNFVYKTLTKHKQSVKNEGGRVGPHVRCLKGTPKN